MQNSQLKYSLLMAKTHFPNQWLFYKFNHSTIVSTYYEDYSTYSKACCYQNIVCFIDNHFCYFFFLVSHPCKLYHFKTFSKRLNTKSFLIGKKKVKLETDNYYEQELKITMFRNSGAFPQSQYLEGRGGRGESRLLGKFITT